MKIDWEGRFRLYDAENPHVYQAFKRYALELRAAGRNRGSAAMIFERLRWDEATRGKREAGMPEWKINNSYRSIMSRRLAAEDPSFENFFEFRIQKSIIPVWR